MIPSDECLEAMDAELARRIGRVDDLYPWDRFKAEICWSADLDGYNLGFESMPGGVSFSSGAWFFLPDDVLVAWRLTNED